jgi:hypothetical protein
MTMSREPEQLRPALERAESALTERLAEACSEDPSEESTAELIRLEEMLTEAAGAAKEAISIRRRLGVERERAENGDEAEDRAAAGAGATGDTEATVGKGGVEGAAEVPDEDDPASAAGGSDKPGEGVRDFVDREGRMWHVWEISREQLRSSSRSRAFIGAFTDGWLAFQTEDGLHRRRLPDYPGDWRELSSAAIEDLCMLAEPVKESRKREGASGSQD